MSIRKETFDDAKLAMDFLENIAHSNIHYIFRGHKDSAYRLQTSWSRSYKCPVECLAYELDRLINKFRVGLTKSGLTPFENNNRMDWLEFARHHGVPTPCLDFTYSPYFALFFAFNGIRDVPIIEDKKQYVAIYALDIFALAHAWASKFRNLFGHGEDFDQAYQKFLYPGEALFEDGFPITLQFVPFPSKHNRRMQRQLGALLYDTYDYSMIGFSDLEDLIENIKEPDVGYPNQIVKPRDPTLTKILVNKKCARYIFERLELMGIIGTFLYGDPSGVAMDVINSYYYNPKTSYLRDIGFPPISDDVRM